MNWKKLKKKLPPSVTAKESEKTEQFEDIEMTEFHSEVVREDSESTKAGERNFLGNTGDSSVLDEMDMDGVDTDEL